MDNIITFKAELLSVFCNNLFVIYESKTQFYYIFPMFPYKA